MRIQWFGSARSSCVAICQKVLLFLVVFSFLVGIPSMASAEEAKTFYVKNADENGSGDSWANALNEQGFIETLQEANEKTETEYIFWVAAGSYHPVVPVDSSNITETDRQASFTLTGNVKLYGGFSGTETTLASRDLTNKNYETILTGDLASDDIALSPEDLSSSSSIIAKTKNRLDNSYSVVVIEGSEGSKSEARIDGFTISGGYANYYSYYGGGIYIWDASPSIVNCTFTQNFASNGGGAILMQNASPTVTNCTFSENAAVNGGAVANYLLFDPLDGISVEATFKSCDFSENHAEDGGGAIANYARAAIMPTVQNNAALEVVSSQVVKIEGCRFSENSAQNTGGAILNRTSEGYYESYIVDLSVDIRNSVFEDNYIYNSYYYEGSGGGAIRNISLGYRTMEINIIKSKFLRNLAVLAITEETLEYEEYKPVLYGGAIMNGGYGYGSAGRSANTVRNSEISATNTSFNVNIAACTFEENEASACGGAIFSSGIEDEGVDLAVSVSIFASTYKNNKSGGNGGAITTASQAFLSILNSTFFGNEAAEVGGAIATAQEEEEIQAEATALADTPLPKNVLLLNNTISENRAGSGAAFAGGPATNALAVNNIFWNNSGASEILLDAEGILEMRNNVFLVDGLEALEGSILTNENAIAADPILSALANNGGTTETMAINALGSARKSGLPVKETLNVPEGLLEKLAFRAVPSIDQRGKLRAGNVDIGAYEYQTDDDGCEGECGDGCNAMDAAFLLFLTLPLFVVAKFCLRKQSK